MQGRNIFKGLLNPEYKPPRTGFDLSQRHIFSLKAGALVPCCVLDYVPNDYFEIDMADLIRTMPLNTAAFLRCKVHFDWYAVPYRQLWSRFNQFAVTRRDLTSTSQIGKDIKYQPNVLIDDLFTSVNGMPTKGIVNKQDSIRLLDMLGYGDYTKTPTGNWQTASVSPFRLAAYQKIFHDYYRNPWRDIPAEYDVQTYNFDDLLCTTPVNSIVGLTNNPYGPSYDSANTYPITRGTELIRLRYRGWKKDIYMGSLPDSQFGAVSAVPLSTTLSGVTSSDASRWLKYGGSDFETENVGTVVTINPYNGGTTLRSNGSPTAVIQHDHTFSATGSSSLSILDLRYYTALQKWKESVMRAGYRTKNQFEAQYGSYDSHDDYDMAIHLGSSYTQIGVDEVVSTSSSTYVSAQQTGNGALGELAGKGIGVGQHDTIKFSAGGTYGVLMCLVSVVPEAEYDSIMVDKNVRRFEFSDYYQPMFDNLGMDSISACDLGANFTNPAHMNDVIGYAPRNWEYKTAVDRVHGSFQNGGALQSWVSQRRYLQSIVNSGSLRIKDYYINPSVLDTVFAAMIQDEGQSADWSYDTDQFLCNCNFSISAVRGMSALGLPQW